MASIPIGFEANTSRCPAGSAPQASAKAASADVDRLHKSRNNKLAAMNGLGALAFSWSIRRGASLVEHLLRIIRSDQCVPLGHTVNANIAMVSSFRCTASARKRSAADRKDSNFSATAQCARRPRHRARRTNLGRISGRTRQRTDELVGLRPAMRRAAPVLERRRIWSVTFAPCRMPESIRPSSCSRPGARDEHICDSLELFAEAVMPAFKADLAQREEKKRAELKPFIDAALKRKRWMRPLPIPKSQWCTRL